jgi:hypothetical protein
MDCDEVNLNKSSRMFRDASQPVRSNKPTPTVCVIRLLIVIPPITPEFKLHPATRSQSSQSSHKIGTGPDAPASYQSGSLPSFWAMCCERDLLCGVGTTTRAPKWIKPQFTRLVDGGWLHEIKYDGYRMHARTTAAISSCLLGRP